MKVKNIFILAAMSLTLASCSDLFEPADENNRGLNEIYNEQHTLRDYWDMVMRCFLTIPRVLLILLQMTL